MKEDLTIDVGIDDAGREEITEGLSRLLADSYTVSWPFTRRRIAQALGVAVIWTVLFGIAFGFFKLQNKFTKGGIRPTAADETAGLDIPEMGVLAYVD